MRRLALMAIAFLFLGAPVMPAAAAEADTALSGAVSEQSAAAAGAHDHGDTCGGGGSCCSACQIRQKYAVEKEAEGGCPCQRAKRAREQAQAEAKGQATDSE